ncbi:hypothetical protein V8G54_005586 [Vigna mungo]|uniref:GRF-type domain-containing protein n=1 Tax=Vigna mungo TaxID=3915 RepID=A0AAQ3S3V6_VIGMU
MNKVKGFEIEVGDFFKWLREEARDNLPFHCWRRRGQSKLVVTPIEVSGPLPVNDGLVGCKFVPCPPVGVGVGSGIKESFIMDEERIKIVVHHTGKFLADDNGVFKFDGEIAEWRCDVDLLSYFGIVASVKELGHMDIKELWYGLGGQSVHPDRLELLTDDKGAMHMLNIAKLNDEVHLYVVHNMVEPQIIEFIDWVGGEEGYGVDVEVHTEGDGQEGGEVQVEGVEVQVEGGEVQVEDAGVDEVQDGEVQGEVQVEVQVEVHHVEEPKVHEVDDFEVEDLGEDDDVEDNDDDELHENESEAESEEEDLHDVSVECDIGYYKGNVREEHSSPVVESSESSDNENNMDAMRGLSDNDDVEESEGEEDGGSSKSKTTFPTFSMPRSMDGYKWEVGTFFAEKKEFMDAIQTYALSNGRNMKFIKNDKKRIIVKCLGGKGKCNWYAYCAFRIDVNAWQLRKVVDTHSCSRDFNVKLMTSKWLSERMEKSVRENPSMKVMDIRDKVTRKWNKTLYYGHELLKTNPGSTVQIKVDNINGEACKDSFVSCRPIVGLDGCFLKTKYGGELLTAVGRDGNEQMLPIAYAVVEVENKESWTWFLELLIEDLGGKDVCAGITFISDQQKKVDNVVVLEDGPSLFVCVMHNGNGGGRGGSENGGPFCYCLMKCVVRTARTAKNRGKQFWGCPKFKLEAGLIGVFFSQNGGEDGGCNYFSWCTDHGVVERETSVKCEGMSESFLNRESMEGGWKIISEQMDLSVNKLGNRINVLVGMDAAMNQSFPPLRIGK